MKVIRPRIARYAVIGTALVTLVSIGSVAFTLSWQSLPALLNIVAFFATGVWLFFVEPRIRFNEDRVEVRNPLRVLRADWSAVDGFETKFGLTFLFKNRKFVAWSAPSPTRLQARRIDRHEFKGSSQEGFEFVEPGRSPSSASGEALLELERAREASKGVKGDATVTTNWYGVAGLAAVIALGYLALHY